MEKNIMLDQQTNKKIAALFKLCLKINGNESRQRGVTGNLPTVFFDVSGHTATVSIRVFSGGWMPHADADAEYVLHFDNRFKEEEFRAAYNYLINLAVETSDNPKKKRVYGDFEKPNAEC